MEKKFPSKIYFFLLKHWKLATLLVLVLLVVFLLTRNKNSEVETFSLKRGDLQEELTLSGEISAINYARMSFESAGKIVYVGVKEGDKVSKGKLLSKIDATVLNANYQSALSNLRIYEATSQNILDQVKGHSADETFAQKDLRTTAEANKDKAYEAVIAAKRTLDGANLYSPFDGIITYLAHPFTGVYSSVGSVEVEVIDPSTMYFNVLADQTEVTKIKSGQKAKIVLDPFEKTEFEAEVATISFVPKPGEAGSVYSVKTVFKNVDLSNSQFKIAMSGDAKFVVSEKQDILYVPNKFVKQDKNGKYLKTDAKKGKLYVETGIESEEFTEVIGDLKEGQILYD